MSDDLSALLAAVWQKNLLQFQTRLGRLDQVAAETALVHAFPEPLRAEAISIAHKLAGSLGMFGYMRGTEIARELEVFLHQDQPDPTRLTQLTRDLRAAVFPPQSQ